jgi:hypothetical protein
MGRDYICHAGLTEAAAGMDTGTAGLLAPFSFWYSYRDSRVHAREAHGIPRGIRTPSFARAADAADPGSRLGIVWLMKAADAFIAGKKALTGTRSLRSMRGRVPVRSAIVMQA